MRSFMNTVTLGLWSIRRPDPAKVNIRSVSFFTSILSGMDSGKLRKLIAKLHTMDGTLPHEYGWEENERLYLASGGTVIMYCDDSAVEEMSTYINDQLNSEVTVDEVAEVHKFNLFPSSYEGKRICACDAIVDEDKDCSGCIAAQIKEKVEGIGVTLEWLNSEEERNSGDLVEATERPQEEPGIWHSLCSECGEHFHVHKAPDFEHDIRSPCCGSWSKDLGYALEHGDALHICLDCSESWTDEVSAEEACPMCGSVEDHKMLTEVPSIEVHI